MKHRKSVSLLLAGATTVAMLTGPVQAAEAPSPQELAAARLQSEGLMKGDENGELHLEDDLTRAELACLISPIILNPEHVAWETEWYTRMCTTNFNDVPEWAQVAVGVCASMGTMAGYGDGLFGPSDPVSPQMACTVMLRYLEQDGWTYDTACEKAAELGLAPAGSLEGDAITRGDIRRAYFLASPCGSLFSPCWLSPWPWGSTSAYAQCWAARWAGCVSWPPFPLPWAAFFSITA